jgi:F-type H+-transporting ATPase subunit alpha
MAVTLLAANNGYFDDVPTEKVLTFESGLHGFMSSKYKAVMDDIEKTLVLSDEGEKKVVKAIEDYKATNTY